MNRGVRMAENKDMQTEYNLFADVWKFFKGHYDMPCDEAMWEKIMKEFHDIARKYDNQLCNDLLIAITMEIQRKVPKDGDEK